MEVYIVLRTGLALCKHFHWMSLVAGKQLDLNTGGHVKAHLLLLVHQQRQTNSKTSQCSSPVLKEGDDRQECFCGGGGLAALLFSWIWSRKGTGWGKIFQMLLTTMDWKKYILPFVLYYDPVKPHTHRYKQTYMTETKIYKAILSFKVCDSKKNKVCDSDLHFCSIPISHFV